MQISLFNRIKNNSMEGCVAVWQRWMCMVCMIMISFFPDFSLWSLWRPLPPPPSPCWPVSRLRQYSSKCLSSMRSTKNSMMGSFPECSSGVTSNVSGTSSKSWWVSCHHQRCWYPSPISQQLRPEGSKSVAGTDERLLTSSLCHCSGGPTAKVTISLSLIKDCSKLWW